MSTQNCCFLEDLIRAGVFKLRFSWSRGQKDRGFSGQPSQRAVRGNGHPWADLCSTNLGLQVSKGRDNDQKCSRSPVEFFQLQETWIHPWESELWSQCCGGGWGFASSLHPAFVSFFLLLKIKIIPMARNNVFFFFFFFLISEIHECWKSLVKEAQFQEAVLSLNIFSSFTYKPQSLHLPWLQSHSLCFPTATEIKAQNFPDLATAEAKPDPLLFLPAWALLPQMRSRTQLISQGKKKILTKLLRTTLKF